MKTYLSIATVALTASLAAAQAADSTEAKVDTANVANVENSASVPVAVAIDSLAKAQPTSTDSTAVSATAQVPDSLVQAPVTDSLAQASITDSLAQAPAVDSLAEAPAADSAAVPADTAKVVTEVAATDSIATDTIAKAVIPTKEATPIGGNIHGFLKADHSPYKVTENLTVDKISVLVIEPGVTLQFAPGTGLYVQGQMVVIGTTAEPVQFKATEGDSTSNSWEGIFISGEATSELSYTQVSGAKSGIAVENSAVKLQSVKIEKSSDRGVFIKNSTAEINDSEFSDNKGVALHVASYATANVERAKFAHNKVALLNAPLARTELGSSTFEGNDYAILNQGNNQLSMNNSSIRGNKVGVSSAEVLDQSVLESIGENEKNFASDSKTVESTVPAEPTIPGVESRAVNSKEKIGDLMENESHVAAAEDTTAKSWSIIGNVMLGGNYHYVFTHRHTRNTFQVPGFGGEASVYLQMTSPTGQVIEFNSDLTADSWNHFSPNPVTLSYTDEHNRLVLGDFQKNAGDIYMSNLPIFGAGYTLSLLKNNADKPLLSFDGYFGETRRPYILGERHPYMYNDYIEDGEQQAQRIAYGGSVTWAPVRRFDATVGAIYSNDELKDPILRDGSSKGSTSDAMQTSYTMYADGNWLFYPGDIELRGMVAVGRSDTADVARERAINQVFSEAGLSVSSYSKIRDLMNNESKISTLTGEELEAIFGDDAVLTRGQMRDSLRTLIREAKLAKREADSDLDDSRVLGVNWGSQNIALGASLYWNINKTTISGHFKYVGEDFYSAGSADQLADTREFGGDLKQIISKFWTFNFGYQINVENAAKYGKTNLFGLGEGTRWGLFTDASDEWYDEHELDNDRTKYIQTFKVKNDFNITQNITANLGYNMEYRTQYRPYQLHGDYILSDGIYRDEWFSARKGKATTKITDGDYTTPVDSARWAQYMSLAGEEYLASRFKERILKYTWNAGVTVKAHKSVFKVDGRWTLRNDYSEFKKDDNIDGMDLADSTWAKLGYYFGGADYFEQTYPVSVTTTLDILQNSFAVTPRFKSYVRDDMSEAEITVDDELEIPFMNRFLILGLNGEFRYMSTTWTEDSEDESESESDILGSVNIKLNHTKHLSSEWYTGAALYYRPDNAENEYKDLYFGVNVNYAF